MDKLTRLANLYASDKGTIAPSTGHHGPRLHFTPVYDECMQGICNNQLTFLEIGVGSGPSLPMWYNYFPNAEIHAIDILPQSQHNRDRIKTYVCDQSNRDQLLEVLNKIGVIDVVVDDGSHVVSHQQISLGVIFKNLKSGGLYWIEDLHTSDGSVWQGKQLYGYDMSFAKGESTVEVIENYIETKTFNSPFLSKEENEYLTNNIGFCTIYELPKTSYGFNKLALFKKI